jgi:hypothetical protein
MTTNTCFRISSGKKAARNYALYINNVRLQISLREMTGIHERNKNFETSLKIKHKITPKTFQK